MRPGEGLVFGAKRVVAMTVAVFVTASLLVGTAGVQGPPAADAAVGSEFNPGFIVTDQNFYDGAAMTAAQVQAFLNARVPTCSPSATEPCLKDYRADTESRAAVDGRCGAYTGANNQSAAQIITDVGRACGISQKALIVLLQKEQSLITSTKPTEYMYRTATGYACPDTSACDVRYYGFFNQVYMAALQFKRYAASPTSWRHQAGKTVGVFYHPNSGCGTLNVFIQNKATAGLYNYTPYTPNAAALGNLYGTGDSCSSYGNRNFWRLWSDWFGSPTNDNSPYGAITTVTTMENGFTLRGWGVDPDSAQSSNQPIDIHVYVDGVKKAAVTADKTDASLEDYYRYYGTTHVFEATITGLEPGLHQVCVYGINLPGSSGQNSRFPCVDATAAFCGTSVPCPAVDRLSAGDRYGQAIQVARAAYPSGAPVVYITTGENFPDALSAAPAAAHEGGPLLLTPSGFLPSNVRSEIDRLAPSRVVIVGGVSAVSTDVETALRALVPATSRIDGTDRFAVSRALARSVFGTSTDILIATGANFPDALSADVVGAALGRPVLLVDGGARLDASTAEYLADAGVERAILVGGTAVIAPRFEDDLAQLVAVERLAGSDRFATSHLANAKLSFTPGGTAYLSTGMNFPDALAGSVLAARAGAPLFLTTSSCIPRSITEDIIDLGVSEVVLLGGEAALSERVAQLTRC
jgi:putative cell wall-binding protein